MNSLKVSHCDAQHQRPLAGVLRFPASSCISRTRCGLRQQQRAYQSQASHALEQQHEVNNRTSEQQEHHINPDEWDMNYWHYQPWWLQPPMVVGTGVAFVLAALVLDNEELGKTALLAAGPVALYWGIFLLVLPRRFKSFAVEYIETHPESEAAALEHQQQQIQEMQEQLLHTLEQQQQQEQEGHQEQH